MDELDRKLVEFTNNDKNFVMTAEYLLQLASQAKQIFESSQPPQKNKILRALLAKPNFESKKASTNPIEALQCFTLWS